MFSQQRSAPPAAITHAATKPVRQFLTSGDADQTVSDDGTFRKLFLAAISGDSSADVNGDGYVTASELGFNLSDRVTNLTRGAQTPRSGKLRDLKYDRGDFVFMLPQTKITAHLASLPEKGTAPTRSFRVDQTEVELAFWESVKDSDRTSDFEAYLGTYPAGQFSLLAHARIEAMTRERKRASERSKADQSGVFDQRLWATIEDSTRPSDYEAYLEAFPNGQYAFLARNRAKSLREQQVARLSRGPQSAPALPVTSPIDPAEARKILTNINENESRMRVQLKRIIEREKIPKVVFNSTKVDCDLHVRNVEIVERLNSEIVVQIESVQPTWENSWTCPEPEIYTERYLFSWDGSSARPVSLLKNE
ncbi:MAG: hypothetical protein HOJ90_14445 [Alphaproteobacteria bacterium]|nr:hypothetical protein [Alphaproteobacteria bacterium]